MENATSRPGFYLRSASLPDRVSLPGVSGGGPAPGVTQDYAIELKEGDYLFSCRLNPTPDYRINVTAGQGSPADRGSYAEHRRAE